MSLLKRLRIFREHLPLPLTSRPLPFLFFYSAACNCSFGGQSCDLNFKWILIKWKNFMVGVALLALPCWPIAKGKKLFKISNELQFLKWVHYVISALRFKVSPCHWHVSLLLSWQIEKNSNCSHAATPKQISVSPTRRQQFAARVLLILAKKLIFGAWSN